MSQVAGDSSHDSDDLIALSETNVEQATPTASQATLSQVSQPVCPHWESYEASGVTVEDLPQQPLGKNSGTAMPTLPNTPDGALLDEQTSPTCAGLADKNPGRSAGTVTPPGSQSTPAQASPTVGMSSESYPAAEIVGRANQAGAPVQPPTELLGKIFPEKTERDRGSLSPTISDIPASAPALESGSGDRNEKNESKAEEPQRQIDKELAGPTCSFCGRICSKWCRTGGRQWREEKKFAPHGKRKKEGDP